jgi:23S rRNA pseudouridine1911/1915/1917 synthase
MPGNRDRTFAFVIEDEAGKRLDALIASAFPEISRTVAGRLIREGIIRVNESIKKPSVRVNPDDFISGCIPDSHPFELASQPIDIDILFENETCLVINKQAGLVVHPSPGHDTGTLANGLIHLRPEINGVGGVPGRPGIVHRLDKDTSGVMVIAKTDNAFRQLALQFRERTIDKSYLGFVYGNMPETGHIDLPIGRHASDRKKMSATNFGKSRDAETIYHLIKQFNKIALVQFAIKTGRTHQIRVHSAAIGHPIVGDPVYGIKKPHKLLYDQPMIWKIVKEAPRQLLHSWRLSFTLPDSENRIEIEAPIPEDMQAFHNKLACVENLSAV